MLLSHCRFSLPFSASSLHCPLFPSTLFFTKFFPFRSFNDTEALQYQESPAYAPKSTLFSVRIKLDSMISSSDNSSDISSRSINTRYVSFPNMISLQLGKRKKELLPREADHCFISNGDDTRIGGNLTPTRRKKNKFIKMSPGESLHSNENVPLNNANASFGIKDGIQLKRSSFGIKDGIQLQRSDADSGNSASKEKTYVGGSLDMLMDAIQVIEYQRLHTSMGLHGQVKDLISVLPENIKLDKNSTGRPSLQNEQFWACGGKELQLGRQPWDGQYNRKGILKVVDMESDGGAMPRTRSKEGWLPTLPSKYSDSVLQPWKKVAKKVPKY